MPARPRPAVPHNSASKPVKSAEPNPDELALLGQRSAGAHVTEKVVRRDVKTFVTAQERHDASDGEWAHFAGGEIVRFYRAGAETHYSRHFVEFVETVLGVPRSTMFRYLKVAKYATRAQSHWGVTTVLAVGQVIEKLRSTPALRRRFGVLTEPETINDLKDVHFELPGGEVVDFGGKRVTKSDVVKLLRFMNGGNAGRLEAEYARKNAHLRETIRASSKLKGVVARFRRRSGRREFQLKVPATLDLREVLTLLSGALENG